MYQIGDNVIYIDFGGALPAASPTPDTNRPVAVFFRQVFKFAFDPVALSCRRIGTEIVSASYHGKMRQHAAVPSSCAVA